MGGGKRSWTDRIPCPTCLNRSNGGMERSCIQVPFGEAPVRSVVVPWSWRGLKLHTCFGPKIQKFFVMILWGESYWTDRNACRTYLSRSNVSMERPCNHVPFGAASFGFVVERWSLQGIKCTGFLNLKSQNYQLNIVGEKLLDGPNSFRHLV